MVSFLKVFGQGVLCVILSPLIVLTLALYAVYCCVVFIYIAIRSIIVFFAGGTPLGDLPEDVEAKRILMERNKNQEDAMKALATMYQQQQAVPVFTTENDGSVVETTSSDTQVQESQSENDVAEEEIE